MKNVKILLLMCLLTLTTISYAQLEVDTNNRILFGPKVFNNGISIADERTGTATTGTPFRIIRTGNSSLNDRVYFTRSTTALTSGWVMQPDGRVVVGNNMATNPNSYAALDVYAKDIGGFSIEVEGAIGTPFEVYMATTPIASRHIISYTTPSGTLFAVRGNGDVFSRTNYYTSDVSLKREIETLNSSLEKVMQLRGVSYYMDNGDDQEKEIPLDELLKNKQKGNSKITAETVKQMQAEKKRKNIGVIAQEVEKVLPEAVRTRDDGLKAVSYSDLTVLLIEAVKEQQTIIDDMKLEMAAMKGNSLRSSEATGLKNDLIAACVLSQNTPNPFNEQTEINYYVAPGAKNAFICIFDMQGKMLQKLDAQIGQNTLLIEGSQLEAGIYLYSLIVDGQEIDTKRMILTK